MRRCVPLCILSAALVFTLVGCYIHDSVTGSGVLVTRELAYRDFDSIELLFEADLTVEPAADFGVTLTADDNVIDLVTVYMADGGGTLRLGLDRYRSYRQVSVAVEVRMPLINRLTLDRHRSVWELGAPSATVQSGFTGLSELTLDAEHGELVLEDVVADHIEVIVGQYGSMSGRLRASSGCTIENNYHDIELTGSLDMEAHIESRPGLFNATIADGAAIATVDIEAYGGELDMIGAADALLLKAVGWSDVDLSGLEVVSAAVEVLDTASVSVYATDAISGKVLSSAGFTYQEVTGLNITDLVIESEEEIE